MSGSKCEPLRSEKEYEAALAEIASYFAKEPLHGTIEAKRFDALARLIKSFEDKHWRIV